MAASAPQIAQLRRMCNLSAQDPTYTDEVLADLIEAHPRLDENGEEPTTLDRTTTPPTPVPNPAWISTYDLHAAAADVWDEKAAALADTAMDFEADGAVFDRNQLYQNALAQARYHRSRRSPRTVTLIKWPRENRAENFPWIGNLPEDDE